MNVFGIFHTLRTNMVACFQTAKTCLHLTRKALTCCRIFMHYMMLRKSQQSLWKLHDSFSGDLVLYESFVMRTISACLHKNKSADFTAEIKMKIWKISVENIHWNKYWYQHICINTFCHKYQARFPEQIKLVNWCNEKTKLLSCQYLKDRLLKANVCLTLYCIILKQTQINTTGKIKKNGETFDQLGFCTELKR